MPKAENEIPFEHLDAKEGMGSSPLSPASSDESINDAPAAGSSSQTAAGMPSPAAVLHPPPAPGPELLQDDDTELPLPVPMIASLLETTKGEPLSDIDGASSSIRRPAGVEEIYDDVNDPRAALMRVAQTAALLEKKEKAVKNAMKIESWCDEVDAISFIEIEPPAPSSQILASIDDGDDGPIFRSSIEDDDVAAMHQKKKKAALKNTTEIVATEEPTVILPSNDLEIDATIDRNTTASSNQKGDEESQQSSDDDGVPNIDPVDTASSNDATDVPPIPIPRAVLVEVEDQEDIPIYDAVQVLDESSRRRRQKIIVGSVATLSVAVIIATVVGAVLGSDNRPPGPIQPTKSFPTVSPTFSPPPLNCTVENLGPFYETNCNVCNHAVGRDGDLIIMFKEGSEIQVLSDINGTLLALGSYLPNHYVEEIAFTSNSFFSSEPYPNDGYGVVYVSPKDSLGIHLNQTMNITPAHEDVDAYSQFGTSIAVDGDVLVVGAPNDAGNSGSAFIYRQADDTTWLQEAKLDPDDASVQNFGSSVLVKNNLILVADDHYGNASKGAVFVYEKVDSLSDPWQLLVNSTLLTNEDCDGRFGASLAFTNNGGLLIGCPLDYDARGAVYYYQKSDDGMQYALKQKITAKNGKSLEKFGGNNHHLAVNSNGDFVAVGTYDDSSGLNEVVYIFAKVNDTWGEIAKIDAPDDSSYFGSDIVIFGDRLLIASWENTYSYMLTCFDQE